MINCFSSAFSASFSFKSFGIVISKWELPTWAKNDLVVSPLKKQIQTVTNQLLNVIDPYHFKSLVEKYLRFSIQHCDKTPSRGVGWGNNLLKTKGNPFSKKHLIYNIKTKNKIYYSMNKF